MKTKSTPTTSFSTLSDFNLFCKHHAEEIKQILLLRTSIQIEMLNGMYIYLSPEYPDIIANPHCILVPTDIPLYQIVYTATMHNIKIS